MSEPAPRGLGAFANRRLIAIFAMGFASGLPIALVGGTLQIWLVDEGYELSSVGAFALIRLAYSLKFLWAPVFDGAAPGPLARLGRRRGWLVGLELALAPAIAALGLSDPSAEFSRVVALGALVAFLGASQDVVIDAFRIDLLALHEQGAGATATQWGYKFGQLASGAGALWLAAAFGFSLAYLALASLLGVGLVAALACREPIAPERARAGGLSALVEPLRDLIGRPSLALLLTFIAIYKLGDALAGGIASAFYRELGFSLSEIASVTKLFGLAAAMLGLALGGGLVLKLGIARGLLAAGAFQMLSNLGFVALAHSGADLGVLTAVVFAESFSSGLASAPFVAFLSALCNPAFTATHYALLSSVASIGGLLLASSSGWLVERLGWSTFFAVTTLAALPGMALALRLARAGDVSFAAAPPARRASSAHPT